MKSKGFKHPYFLYRKKNEKNQ